MNMTLYKIADQYALAVEKLSDEDLPPEAIADTLEALQGDLQTKATNVAMYAQNLEALARQIREAEQAMSHRRKVLENKAASIRQYLKENMERAGIAKIECPYFKLSIKKNPPSVEIYDEASIPEVYKKQLPPPPAVPDKKMIAEVIKGGGTVDGARMKHETRLSID
jgi:hypothetical protein